MQSTVSRSSTCVRNYTGTHIQPLPAIIALTNPYSTRQQRRQQAVQLQAFKLRPTGGGKELSINQVQLTAAHLLASFFYTARHKKLTVMNLPLGSRSRGDAGQQPSLLLCLGARCSCCLLGVQARYVIGTGADADLKLKGGQGGETTGIAVT